MNEKSKKQKYDVFAVIKRMLTHLWQQEPIQFGRIAIYTILAAIYPFMAVFLPKIAIGILEQGGADTGKNLVFTMGIYFVAAGVLAVLTKYLLAYISTRNMRIRLMYIAEMSKKLMTMDYRHFEDAKFFEEYEKGINAGNSNYNGIEGVYNKLSELPANFLALLGMVILAGALSPILLISLVVHVLVIMWTSKLTHDYEYKNKQELSKAARRIGYYKRTTQDFSYGKDIRIFNLRDRIMENYQEEINAYLVLFAKIRNREYALGFLSLLTLLITNVLTYGILIYEVLHGMPVSSFTMYVTMTTTLMTSMITFGNDLAFVWNEGEYVDDFYRFLDSSLVEEGTKTKIDIFESKEKVQGKEDLKNDTLEIRFEHVSFRYPHTEKNVFTDLNFTIHAGERLAIVGVNGAGKSTLVKLMTGLFAPTEGKIYINGVDITEIKKEELYDLYSAVFQEVNVLAFTLRENVGCHARDVDDGKVQIALEKVGLWNKVEGFTNGLDQMMLKVIDENGTDFSGGERQKLSIARGLYKDAPMVIMDEPTAALDALAEAEIYENFSSLVEGKTAVYISHRLASTRFCDKIALFDADGLKEYGTHEELMEKKGKYYDMFVIQGKYYQEEAV
ncbi:MAG: ABC transporter ATP-binding protein [Agathobacter sp.]|nr:ABC transporter ATP-binding protein [Agathobacter sp.]